ncbi:NACHT domain-containing protein [Thauera sinica]|uniref:NACHT domain-containing protein n=1 Tax=Thauera sinica TaxID=2665146 RepID=A0ABW1AXC7_9RHOO|nr:NACHT domain-containing protein [Thauera sp. K11]ATE61837.1 hypothetical protein CCZ27_19365 [Thauera sp. K11]
MGIPIIDWFEDPIKSSVNSVFSGINAHFQSLDVIKQYRLYHFEMLKQQVSGIKILGMQNPMDLKNLYYPANVSTDIRRRIYTPEWATLDGSISTDYENAANEHIGGARYSTKAHRGMNRNRQIDNAKTREPGDDYIDKNNRVIILGGPGAGKTTFLKFIALAYSDRDIFKRTNLKKTTLPIYIHLPSLAREPDSVIDFISSPLVSRTDVYAHQFYKRLMEKGLCTVLMDSLDEVPTEAKQALIQKVKSFAALFPKARIVITCRTADYDQIFEDFSEVELARLSKEAVESIVRAWFGKTHERAEKLISLLENDEAVASLTETPLLLSLLCIQFKNDLALPKRKTELYRRCIDALLRDWDTTRGFRRDTAYSQLSDDRKEKIFEALAGSACKEYIDYEFHETFILSAISSEIARFSMDPNDAKGILTEIESHHGIVEKCSAETYEFSHATMQEYFAAKYFVAKRKELEVLKKHYDDEGWHNVILFMASMMDDSSSILNFLAERSSTEKFQNYPAFGRRLAHLLLLYRCMAMGVNLSPDLRSNMCSHLVHSQINMIQQINKDGVLPYAVRRPNGVRQALFTYRKSRESIDRILKPYRSLMNEIVLSPIKEYSEKVVEAIRSISMESGDSSELYKNLGLATCLLVPVSAAKPEFFFERMMNYSDRLLQRRTDSIRGVLVESITAHRAMFPRLFDDERTVRV